MLVSQISPHFSSTLPLIYTSSSIPFRSSVFPQHFIPIHVIIAENSGDHSSLPSQNSTLISQIRNSSFVASFIVYSTWMLPLSLWIRNKVMWLFIILSFLLSFVAMSHHGSVKLSESYNIVSLVLRSIHLRSSSRKYCLAFPVLF